MSARPPRPRSQRLLWLRPVLFASVVLLMPLSWTESVGVGCGRTAGTPTVSTGVELLLSGAESLILIPALASLALLWLGARASPALTAVSHLGGAVANGWLAFFLYFAVHFSFVEQRVFAPAWLAIGAASLATLEALVRLGLAIREFVLRERRAPEQDTSIP